MVGDGAREVVFFGRLLVVEVGGPGTGVEFLKKLVACELEGSERENSVNPSRYLVCALGCGSPGGVMGEQDGPEYLSVGDEPELKVIYATVHHIIESGCLMPWEEISQRRLMVSTNLDLIMIHASEKAYCKKLQAYQKDHNVTVLHDMPGNRYFWREKSSLRDAPHFSSSSEDEKM